MANPEQLKTGGEHGPEVQKAAGERLEQLRNPEASKDRLEDSETRVAAERKEVEAVLNKEQPAKKGGETNTASRRVTLSKKDKKASFKQTMNRAQAEMSPSERIFSKFIHTPSVEKTSEFVGKTVARPNAILAGSISALILVSIVYATARTYGFRLSGFETIAAFILGWVIGVVFDFLRVMVTGKKV